MGKVTIQHVARHAGVSLGTVSNALNHPEKVRPATLDKVRLAMDELGFMPNQSARLLAGGHNASFGLILPSLDHGFCLQIANGAHSEARRNGYGLLIANADNDAGLQGDYMRYFMGTQMAGILVQPFGDGETARTAAKCPVPVVHLDTHSKDDGWFVAVDNRMQGALIAEHAVAQGARRIAVVGAEDTTQRSYRALGIREIQTANPHVSFSFGAKGLGSLARDGYMEGMRLAGLDADARPDFVIALTDVLATGVIAGIQDAGASVPDDIAVAGCDGNPLAWSGAVPLTTCAPTGYEVGRRGVQFLISQIEARRAAAAGGAAAERDSNHMSLIRPFLLARQSSAHEASAADGLAASPASSLSPLV